MNNLMLLVALLFGSQGASALMLDSRLALASIEQPSGFIPSDNGVDGNEMKGDIGVQMFNETMKQSPLYSLLLMLDSETSLVAKNAKYVVMVNEAHQTNVTLTQLLAVTQKNNQLLEQLLIKQGNQYG